MKNLLLSFVLVLLSFAGYSTGSRGIEIINRTDCEVYLQLRGARECQNCEVEFISCLIVIPAGANIIYPNTTTICGLPTAPIFVHSALIYSGPRHCQPLETWIVGDPGCFPSETEFWSMNQECERRCDCMRARWDPASCAGIARLIIEPC